MGVGPNTGRSVEEVSFASRPVIFDEISYFSKNRDGEILTKGRSEYCGIVKRKSDQITCMAIRSPGASRRHQIEIGDLISWVVDGKTHTVEIPRGRWRLREEAIRHVLEDRPLEDWAIEYFDPGSRKYFARQEPVLPPELAALDQSPSQGRAMVYAVLAVFAAAAIIAWLTL